MSEDWNIILRKGQCPYREYDHGSEWESGIKIFRCRIIKSERPTRYGGICTKQNCPLRQRTNTIEVERLGS
jgi:hypothetical protein